MAVNSTKKNNENIEYRQFPYPWPFPFPDPRYPFPWPNPEGPQNGPVETQNMCTYAGADYSPGAKLENGQVCQIGANGVGQWI